MSDSISAAWDKLRALPKRRLTELFADDPARFQLDGLIAEALERRVFARREPSAQLFERPAGSPAVHADNHLEIHSPEIHEPRDEVLMVGSIFRPAVREARFEWASAVRVLDAEHNRRTRRRRRRHGWHFQ